MALIHAEQADRFGNLTFRHLARNFSPLMASAAKRTIVEADHVVELGDIDAHNVHSPAIFTDLVYQCHDVPEDSWHDWRASA